VASLEVGRMILIESSLSFLGLGVPESVPTWGGMLSDSRKYLISAWWFSTLPGLAIVATVTSINLFGDFLRDYFDPRLRGLGMTERR
jgi:peptide/nickel transport system permease protein